MTPEIALDDFSTVWEKLHRPEMLDDKKFCVPNFGMCYFSDGKKEYIFNVQHWYYYQINVDTDKDAFVIFNQAENDTAGLDTGQILVIPVSSNKYPDGLGLLATKDLDNLFSYCLVDIRKQAEFFEIEPEEDIDEDMIDGLAFGLSEAGSEIMKAIAVRPLSSPEAQGWLNNLIRSI